MQAVQDAVQHHPAPADLVLDTITEAMEATSLNDPSFSLPVATFSGQELDSTTPDIGKVVIQALQGTCLASLVSNDPLPLNQFPPTPYIARTGPRTRFPKLVIARKKKPSQAEMTALMKQLAASQAQVQALEAEAEASAMTSVVQHMYLSKVATDRALATKSGKKASYFTDGKGQELTSPGFMLDVHDAEEATKARKALEATQAAFKASEKVRTAGGTTAWVRWKAEYTEAKKDWDEKVKGYTPRKIPPHLLAIKPQSILKKNVIANWERENGYDVTQVAVAVPRLQPTRRRDGSEEDFVSFVEGTEASEDGYQLDDQDD
jgi:hypothetical protein